MKMLINTLEGIRKRNNKKYSILFLALLLNSCRTAPIYNVENLSISPRQTVTEAELSEAIWSAGRRLGWRIEKISPGKMIGEYKVKTHRAVVAIYYDKTHIDIIYKESNNMNYDSGDIHVNYNVWIHKLEQKIQDEITFRYP